MTHRAGQIVDAIAAAIATEAAPYGVKVFTHRRVTLQLYASELDAITVDFGEDEPAADENTQFLDSLLSVEITGVAAHALEDEARKRLLELRTLAHVAVQTDPTFGLAFVVEFHYAGAQAPVTDASGDEIVIAQTWPWLVYYRMNLSDPS